MKIIDWLERRWKNFKFELNLSTPEEIEERFKPNKEILKGKIEGILGVDYVIREGIIFYSRESKGEEQKEVKKETFERETQELLPHLKIGQGVIYNEQMKDRENLERLDEKLTGIIKMLMDIKDKL